MSFSVLGFYVVPSGFSGSVWVVVSGLIFGSLVHLLRSKLGVIQRTLRVFISHELREFVI